MAEAKVIQDPRPRGAGPIFFDSQVYQLKRPLRFSLTAQQVAKLS
jgi:hypothetical protein